MGGFREGVEFLAIQAAIAIAVDHVEVFAQPGVALGFLTIDPAIAVLIGLAQDPLGARRRLLAAGFEIGGGEVAPPLLVEALEVALEVGLPLDLLAIEPSVAVSVQLFEELLQPPFVGLDFLRCLGLQCQGAGHQEAGASGKQETGAVAPHGIRLWSPPAAIGLVDRQGVTRSV